MKKSFKNVLIASTVGALLSCGMSAFAASDTQATLYSNTVYLQGRPVYCWNAEGKQIDYISCNGTTYVPIRTVGEWMGKTVSWDETSKSILLNGTTEKVYRKQTQRAMGTDTREKLLKNGMTVKIRDDIKLVVDGKQKTLKDAAGKEAYTINYNNINYIPIPSAAELLGMTANHVSKDARTTTFMRTPLTEEQVAQGKAYVDTLQKTYSFTALDAAGVKIPAYLKAQRNVDVTGITGDPNAVDNQDNIFMLMLRYDSQKGPSVEDIKQYAQIGADTMKKLMATKKPDVPVLDFYHEKLMADAKTALESCEAVLKAVADGKDQAECVRLMLQSTEAKTATVDLCIAVSVPVNQMETVLSEKS